MVITLDETREIFSTDKHCLPLGGEGRVGGEKKSGFWTEHLMRREEVFWRGLSLGTSGV